MLSHIRLFLQNFALNSLLPKGVIRGCPQCSNCQKVALQNSHTLFSPFYLLWFGSCVILYHNYILHTLPLMNRETVWAFEFFTYVFKVIELIIESWNRFLQDGIRRMVKGPTFRMLLSSNQPKRCILLLVEFKLLQFPSLLTYSYSCYLLTNFRSSKIHWNI